MTVDDIMRDLDELKRLYGGDSKVTVVDGYANEYEIACVERQKSRDSNNKICIKIQVTNAIN